jgi:hypothetical protein
MGRNGKIPVNGIAIIAIVTVTKIVTVTGVAIVAIAVDGMEFPRQKNTTSRYHTARQSCIFLFLLHTLLGNFSPKFFRSISCATHVRYNIHT